MPLLTTQYFDDYLQVDSSLQHFKRVLPRYSPLPLTFLPIHPHELYIFIYPFLLYYHCHFHYDPTAIILHSVR